MKNLFSLLIILFPLLFMSCEEFLEEYPEDSLVAEGFYSTPDNIELGVVGVYNSLQSVYRSSFRDVNMRDDDSWFGHHGINNQVDLFHKTDMTGFWNSSYAAIKDANELLDFIEEVEFNDPLRKNQLKGELLFVRAICHFNLQNVYADVPYVDKLITNREEAMEYGRTPVSEILQNLESDLEEALDLMKDHHPDNRADKYSVLALLADVNMHQKDWDKAIVYLKDIIDNGNFQLVKVDELFSEKNNAGSIFEVQYNSGGLGTESNFGNFHDRFVVEWGFLPKSVHDGVVPTWDLYHAYDRNSARFEAFLGLAKEDNDSVAWTRKYELQDGADNLRVYRLAEIKLLYAEALLELNQAPNNDAYQMVNMVRRRAYDLPVDMPSEYDLPQGLSYEEFKAELYKEYRLEMSFEMKRFFHLRRTGRFLEVMQNHFQTTPLPEFGKITLYEWMKYWPLPQEEILKNPGKITQNPGWDQM